MLGAQGLVEALTEAGLQPVEVGDPRAVAVVSGYAPDVRWRVIMRAATLIRNGLPWVAANTDLTLPTDDGSGSRPRHARPSDQRLRGGHPVVAGKPQRPLLDETRRRVSGRRPLMVGDRLRHRHRRRHRGRHRLVAGDDRGHLGGRSRGRPARRAPDVDRARPHGAASSRLEASSDGPVVSAGRGGARRRWPAGRRGRGEADAAPTPGGPPWRRPGLGPPGRRGFPGRTGGSTEPGRPTASG